jgi:hypothetical protein
MHSASHENFFVHKCTHSAIYANGPAQKLLLLLWLLLLLLLRVWVSDYSSIVGVPVVPPSLIIRSSCSSRLLKRHPHRTPPMPQFHFPDRQTE